jgi:2-methylcitrate dehydratase PrpD
VTDSAATAALASFASLLTFDDIPPDVVAHSQLCVLDALGCGLFASSLPWCRIVNELAVERYAAGPGTIWGTPLKVCADGAALANGTSGHGFELDDIHPGGMHPGPLAVSAALALAEEHDSSGRDVLTAVVAGYEVGCRVALAMLKGHARAGFHAQGTVGAFVAVATAGNLLRLTPEQLQHALGIVGSMAAGLLAAQEGGMTKRLHSGRAAQNGVQAALLAAKGFTAVPDILENPLGGFCKAMGNGVADASQLTAGLGHSWETSNVGFKIYPSCGGSHTGLHAVRELRRAHAIRAEDVHSVTVHGSSHAVMKVGTPYVPSSVASAQMSLGFTVALMLRFGEVPLDRLTEDGIREPETVELASRVVMHPDPDIDAKGPLARHACRVRIELVDGRVLETSLEHRPGSAKLPITSEDLREKFRSLAAQTFPNDQVQAIEKTVFELPTLATARTLTALLGTTA